MKKKYIGVFVAIFLVGMGYVTWTSEVRDAQLMHHYSVTESK